MAKEEKPFNRKRYFTIILDDLNDKKGFNFTLDKLPEDDSYKYAHGTHADDRYSIHGQMDTDSEHMYGFEIKYFDGDDKRTFMVNNLPDKKTLDGLLETEAFRTRVKALGLLESLAVRLEEERRTIKGNILDDTIRDIELDNAYETITTAARKLIRDRI